jgi:hypothetical protein
VIIVIVGDNTGQINLNMEGIDPANTVKVMQKMVELLREQYHLPVEDRPSGLIVPATLPGPLPDLNLASQRRTDINH